MVAHWIPSNINEALAGVKRDSSKLRKIQVCFPAVSGPADPEL